VMSTSWVSAALARTLLDTPNVETHLSPWAGKRAGNIKKSSKRANAEGPSPSHWPARPLGDELSRNAGLLFCSGVLLRALFFPFG